MRRGSTSPLCGNVLQQQFLTPLLPALLFQELRGGGALPAPPGGGEEEGGTEHQLRRSLQPHAVPPLHGRLEEGGDGGVRSPGRAVQICCGTIALAVIWH